MNVFAFRTLEKDWITLVNILFSIIHTIIYTIMDTHMQAHFDEFERKQEDEAVEQIYVEREEKGEEKERQEEGEEEERKEEREKSTEECQRYKALGNSHYQKGETNEALEMYDLAEECCPLEETKTLAILYSNMSLCYDKHKDNASVIDFTSKAIKSNPSYLKPLLNRAEKYIIMERYDEAVQDYDTILSLDNNHTYHTRRQVIAKLRDQHFEKQKTEALDGLKGLANTVLGKFNMSLDNFKMEQGANGGYNVQFKQ